MLKYEKIIKHLKLEEKVNLLTSNQVLANTMIDNYDLPLFCIIKNVDHYDVPSNEALASTWNDKLIHDAAKEISAHINMDKLIGLKPNLSSNVKDGYFEGKILSNIIAGIEKGKTSACLLDVPVNNFSETKYREEILLPYEIAIKEGKPIVFNSKSLDKASLVMNEFKHEGFSMIELESEYEVIRAINQNLNIIYTSENAKEVIISAVREYERLQRLLNGNQIEKEEIDAKICNNEIITTEQLDNVIDRYLDGLAHIDSNRLYRYKPNTQIFKDVCNESIILLKNEAVLPIDFTSRPALIGQLAKEPLVYNSFDDLYDDAVAAVNCVDFDISGFDYGYFDNEDNAKLLDAAVELAKQSDCAIVYLGTKEGNRLPKNQMDLITKLYENDVKIIAVITSAEPIIMDFDYMCSAILYSKLLSSDFLKSSMEIIGGKINPTGKTIEYFPVNSMGVNPDDPTTYKYPFGYGLSYTIVDYSDLAVHQDGVELTVVNNGAYNTNEVIQLYVEYVDDEGVTHDRKLRYFKKVKLESGEPARVNIEFNEYTFRSYFEDEKCYGIKGGKYNILIGRSINEIELISTIELEQVLFKNSDNSKLVLQTKDEEILDDFINHEDEYIKANKKGLSIKARLAISIPLTTYINIMLIFLVLLTGFKDENLILSVILLVLLVVTDIVFIVHTVKLAKEKRRMVQKKLTEDELKLHVDSLPHFNQLSSFTYPTPKQMVIDEEEIEYTIEEPEEVVEQIIQMPEAQPEAPIAKPITQTEVVENIDFELYVKGFIDYALVYGLIIEPRSARVLLSAMSSSQMVFVRNSSNELLPKLAEIVSHYYNSPYSTFSLAGVQTPFDVMWSVNEENNYEHTSFAKQLRYASDNSKSIVIQTLTNVEPNEIIPVLGNIFKYISNPNEKHYLNVDVTGNEENSAIPRNVRFIVLENDTKYLEKMPIEVANATLSVEVNLRSNQIIDENADIEVKYFTNTLLVNTINKLKENNFIPEEQWKKIDDFEEAFNNLESYAIHNKAMLIYEKFVGALIESGSEMDEVIDYVIASGIIPCLKSTKTYQNNKGDQTIYTMLEKIFGSDILQTTERTIRKPN